MIVIVLVAVVFLLQELAVIRIRRRVVGESELAVARIRQQIEECLATISADDDDIEL